MSITIKRINLTILILLILIFVLTTLSTAENKEKQQMPPANVVVSKVTTGRLAPEQEFIGTVYYLEVSDLSGEVGGSVEIIQFEEGQRTKKGEVLVKLNSDLLEKKLQAKMWFKDNSPLHAGNQPPDVYSTR